VAALLGDRVPTGFRVWYRATLDDLIGLARGERSKGIKAKWNRRNDPVGAELVRVRKIRNSHEFSYKGFGKSGILTNSATRGSENPEFSRIQLQGVGKTLNSYEFSYRE
jgi:hypothetical protein